MTTPGMPEGGWLGSGGHRRLSWLVAAVCLECSRRHMPEGFAGAVKPHRVRCLPYSPPTARFTGRQGRFPAFIHACTKVNERPPTQADMQRCFSVTVPAPCVHRMVPGLDRSQSLCRGTKKE